MHVKLASTLLLLLMTDLPLSKDQKSIIRQSMPSYSFCCCSLNQHVN